MTRKDLLQEHRIQLAWYKFMSCKTPEQQRQAQKKMYDEINRRSKGRVAEMEAAKGLR